VHAPVVGFGCHGYEIGQPIHTPVIDAIFGMAILVLRAAADRDAVPKGTLAEKAPVPVADVQGDVEAIA